MAFGEQIKIQRKVQGNMLHEDWLLGKLQGCVHQVCVQGDNSWLLGSRNQPWQMCKQNLSVSKVKKRKICANWTDKIHWEKENPSTKAKVVEFSPKLWTSEKDHPLTSCTNHLRSSHSAIPSPVCAKGTSTTPSIGTSDIVWVVNLHPLIPNGMLHWKQWKKHISN